MGDYPANAIGPVYWDAPKHPGSVVEYEFDWALELAQFDPVDTISSFVITPDAGITVDSSLQAGASVLPTLSGGTDGSDYNVECEIGTAGGRTLKKTGRLRVRVR